jgi:hypothetical protein|tara:strand:- start:464 stop:649 length:186 start_codon:yes stop_codon:yes gene_type:complete
VLGTKIAGKKAIEILESARNQPMRIPVNPKRNKNTYLKVRVIIVVLVDRSIEEEVQKVLWV